MMRKTPLSLMLIVLLATLLSGCMTTAADAANKATSAASNVSCAGLKGLNKALSQVGGFSPDTAVSDVLAFKRKVDPFVNPIRVVAVTMGMDPVSQFILAYDAFGLLINSLPADANLGAASSALTASMAALMGASVQAEAALHCNT